ncbi:hypothetical protein ACVXG7_06660 [Enterobacter hormaechei]
MVNSIFSPRDITWPGECAAAIPGHPRRHAAPSRARFFIGARNFSVENLIRAVKELNRLACTHAQHAAYMVCGIIRQGDFAAWVISSG